MQPLKMYYRLISRKCLSVTISVCVVFSICFRYTYPPHTTAVNIRLVHKANGSFLTQNRDALRDNVLRISKKPRVFAHRRQACGCNKGCCKKHRWPRFLQSHKYLKLPRPIYHAEHHTGEIAIAAFFFIVRLVAFVAVARWR